MNDNIKEIFMNSPNKVINEQLFALLELPDEQFDNIYPDFIETIKETAQSELIKKQFLEELKYAPETNIEEEIEGFNNIINDIKNDKDLSYNKKDLLINLMNSSKELLIDTLKNPREIIEVKVQKIDGNAILPTYANESDAGADIYSIEEVEIPPHTTMIIKTGLKVSIPAGYMLQIYSRSGLAAKTSLRIANSVGIIDHLYNKEIGVIMENTGDTIQTINKGDRIAQMLIMPTPMIKWKEVTEIEESNRGGFGSTGMS